MSRGEPVGNQSFGAVAANDTVKLIVAEKFSRSSVLIQNRGANEVFIGLADNFTVATGIEVPSGQSLTIEGIMAIYCRCSPGESADVRFLEIG